MDWNWDTIFFSLLNSFMVWCERRRRSLTKCKWRAKKKERKASQLSHDRWSLVKKSTNLSNQLRLVSSSFISERNFKQVSFRFSNDTLSCTCWWLMISLIISIETWFSSNKCLGQTFTKCMEVFFDFNHFSMLSIDTFHLCEEKKPGVFDFKMRC